MDYFLVVVTDQKSFSVYNVHLLLQIVFFAKFFDRG